MNAVTTNNTISVSVNVNVSDIFKAVTDSNFASGFAKKIDYELSNEAIWDNDLVCDIKVIYYCLDDENKTHKKTITPKQLCEAYINAVLQGQTHCFGHSLNANDYDSCFGDFVLQQAVYGEVAYS